MRDVRRMDVPEMDPRPRGLILEPSNNRLGHFRRLGVFKFLTPEAEAFQSTTGTPIIGSKKDRFPRI